MSLIFAWITLSGFQSTKMLFFCLSHLFRFATYRAFIFDRVFLDCIGMRVCQHLQSQESLHMRHNSQASTCPWSLVGKIVSFRAQILLLEFRRGQTFLLEVCFNLFWCSCTRSSCILSSIKLGLLLTGLQNSTGDTVSMLYT